MLTQRLIYFDLTMTEVLPQPSPFWNLVQIILTVGSYLFLWLWNEGKQTFVSIIVHILVGGPPIVALIVSQCMVKRGYARLQDIHYSNQKERKKQSLFWNFFDHPLPLDPYETHRAALIHFYEMLRLPKRTQVLLVATTVGMFLQLYVRLCLPSFQGAPSEFDFGFENGVEGGEKVVAFTKSSATYLNMGIGFLNGTLSFPVISGFLLWIIFMIRERLTGGKCFCALPIRLVIHLAPWIATALPIYWFAILILDDKDGFASDTSYARDCFEWAVGSIIGVGTGSMFTELALFWNIMHIIRRQKATAVHQKASERNTDEEQSRTSIDDEEENAIKEKALKYIEPNFFARILQKLIGLCFLVTAIFSSVLSALTWHKCPNGMGGCVNSEETAKKVYSMESVLLPVFIGVSVLPIVLIIWSLRRQSKARNSSS